METKSYTKRELEEFIQSDLFNKLVNIPISKHRAISQINNPRASDNDILLVVQFDENKVAGYLGILPDYLFRENQYEKIGWLSCFWVDEEYKSKNVAANLFLRVIRSWEQKILITNIVPWLEPIYQKTKIFQPTIYKYGLRCYMRFNLAELLPPKNRIFKRLTWTLRLIDNFINTFYSLRLILFRKLKLKNVKYEYLTYLDNESCKFVETFIQNNWNKRSGNELNWMLSNPWIIQGSKEDFNSKRYYFSSLNERFFQQIVQFSNEDGKILAMLILNIREKNLTVPYVFSENVCIDSVSKFLINTMLELKLNMLTTFNEELIHSLKKSKTPFYFLKVIKKPYLISKKFDFVTELRFQDGDGDCAFY